MFQGSSGQQAAAQHSRYGVVRSDGEKFLLTCACCFSSCMGPGLRATKKPTVKMKDMAVTLRGVQNQGAE